MRQEPKPTSAARVDIPWLSVKLWALEMLRCKLLACDNKPYLIIVMSSEATGSYAYPISVMVSPSSYIMERQTILLPRRPYLWYRERSIVMSVFVCSSAGISREPPIQTSPNCLCILSSPWLGPPLLKVQCADDRHLPPWLGGSLRRILRRPR